MKPCHIRVLSGVVLAVIAAVPLIGSRLFRIAERRAALAEVSTESLAEFTGRTATVTIGMSHGTVLTLLGNPSRDRLTNGIVMLEYEWKGLDNTTLTSTRPLGNSVHVFFALSNGVVTAISTGRGLWEFPPLR